MRTAVIALLLSALPLLAAKAVAGDMETGEETTAAEISYLLSYVADSGCTFTRNGDNHSAPEAADHLRLKYSRGSRWVDSAEDFIDRLASSSSWTDEPYTITCSGHTEATGLWLHRALAGHRDAAKALDPNEPDSN